MTKPNNGRAFEKLVAIIQEAYKDSTHTKIYLNHKIPDKLKKGKKREFDILIITKSNNFDFKIAIECKDYKHPVSVLQIEAFNTKCSTISNINKKIIVSPKGFSSGAMENAEYFDIELLSLSSVDETIVKDWLDVRGIRQIQLNYTIIGFFINAKRNDGSDVIITDRVLNVRSLLKLANGEVIHPTILIEAEIENRVGQQAEFFYAEAARQNVKIYEEKFALDATINIKPSEENYCYVLGNTENFLVTNISVFLRLNSEVAIPINVDIRAYSDLSKSSKGELVSAKFNDENIFAIYKSKDEENGKAFLVENNEISNLSGIAIIDLEAGEKLP